jgi:hypothetical protein
MDHGRKVVAVALEEEVQKSEVVQHFGSLLDLVDIKYFILVNKVAAALAAVAAE